MTVRRPAALVVALALALGAIGVVAPASAPPARAVVGSLIYVTTLADVRTPNNGACSLAEAISAANLDGGDSNTDCVDGSSAASDTIMFQVAGKITLTSELPALTTDVAIDGLTSVTVDGANTYRVFRTISGTTRLVRMTVQHGKAGNGGGVSNEATMFIVNMVIRSSTANYGGGVANTGTLTLDSSTVYGNSASIAGGGVWSTGTMTVYDATVTANTAPTGAGIHTSVGSFAAYGGTFARNTANTDGGGGIRAVSGPAAIQATIVAGNIGKQIVGTVTRTNSIVQTSTDGLLDTALRDNGGDTPTIRLPKGSPALGIGTADSCDKMDLVDQRSFDRPATGCDIGAVQRDRLAPTKLRSPKLVPATATTLKDSRIRAQVWDWAFDDDPGMGIDHFTIQRQLDGGSWTTLSSTIAPEIEVAVSTTGGYNTLLSNNHTYRFRVRATDEDGNVSVWAYTPTVTARLLQETSGAIKYSTGWSTASSSLFSGGAVKHTSTVGKSARITFTGRMLALVTTARTSKTWNVDVYVDGVYKGPSFIAVGSNPTTYRYVPFVWDLGASTTHTVRFVYQGPDRFDIDGFIVLK